MAVRPDARTTLEGAGAVGIGEAGAVAEGTAKEPLIGLGTILATLSSHTARSFAGRADGSARHPEAAVKANLPAVVAV